MRFLKNLKYSLKPNPNKNNRPTTVNQSTLKILVGLLGIFLPFILWIGLWAYKAEPPNHRPIESISHYYYTRMGSWFVVTMSLLAVILIFYKGRTILDVILSTIAGISALFVVFLPTSDLASACGVPEYAVTFVGESAHRELRENTHYISAGIFLFTLAIISICRFPFTDTSPEFNDPKNKKSRIFYTIVYVSCGVVMILAIAAIILGKYNIILKEEWFLRDEKHDGYGTFICETVAVVAFGYSWLLNAGFFKRFMVYLLGDYEAYKNSIGE